MSHNENQDDTETRINPLDITEEACAHRFVVGRSGSDITLPTDADREE